MSDFKVKPWPSVNPANFSKFSASREISARQKKAVVVHRCVEGENNGKCFKIKESKTPFILKHLEKKFDLELLGEEDKSDEEPDEEKKAVESEEDPQQPGTSAKKRENDEEVVEETNPTSSGIPRKKPRQSS